MTAEVFAAALAASSSGFEDRLERELLAAARRRVAADAFSATGADRTADAPSTTAHRAARARTRGANRFPRPPRVALAVAVACVAIAALAILVVALPGARDATTPSAMPAARQCDQLAAAGELRLTDAPVDRRLLRAFGVLRRPQNARDRSDCPSLAPNFATLNPRAIRYADRNVIDRRVFLVPIASNRTLAPSGSRPSKASEPQLCYVAINRRGAAWASCYPPEFLLDGRFLAGSSGPHGSFAWFGVFPDPVATIDLHLADGSSTTLVARSNVVSFSLPGRSPTPSNTVVELVLRGHDGRALQTRAAHHMRPPVAPASPRRP